MNKITIRTAQLSDASEILKIYTPYVENTAITFEYEVPSTKEFEGRIASTLEKYPYIVVILEGKIVGYAYAGAFKSRAAYDWGVEMTVYVDRNLKRMGIGRILYEKIEAILGAQGILNVNACIGYPEKEDEHLTWDSVKFHDKLGYKKIGHFHECGYKFNRWYDMVWMEKLIGEHTDHQESIKTFDEVREQFGL